jgi:hypothetical protein
MKNARAAHKAKGVLDRPPPLQGWRTTDEDENSVAPVQDNQPRAKAA